MLNHKLKIIIWTIMENKWNFMRNWTYEITNTMCWSLISTSKMTMFIHLLKIFNMIINPLFHKCNKLLNSSMILILQQSMHSFLSVWILSFLYHFLMIYGVMLCCFTQAFLHFFSPKKILFHSIHSKVSKSASYFFWMTWNFFVMHWNSYCILKTFFVIVLRIDRNFFVTKPLWRFNIISYSN